MGTVQELLIKTRSFLVLEQPKTCRAYTSFSLIYGIMIEDILGVESHTPLGFCTPLKGKRLDCMIKLIATDMDGTFLRPDGTYDKERFERLLKALTKAEYLFVAASGRSLLTLKELFQDVQDQIAFIAENGCIVEDQGTVLFEAEMLPEDYQLIISELENHPDCQGYLLSGEKGAYAPLGSTAEYLKNSRRFYANVQTIDTHTVTDKILKITTQFQHDKVHDFTEMLNAKHDKFQAVVTGFDGIDVIPKAYDKSTGLAVLCDKLGLGKEDVYAFGDNYNDLEMLAFAGTALVTENGVAKAKALATEVIGANSTDAVLDYLEGLVAHVND